jgi:hypothetical protein
MIKRIRPLTPIRNNRDISKDKNILSKKNIISNLINENKENLLKSMNIFYLSIIDLFKSIFMFFYYILNTIKLYIMYLLFSIISLFLRLE